MAGLADNGDGSRGVTDTLAVELSVGMLGGFRRQAEKVIMETALTALERRVEGGAR